MVFGGVFGVSKQSMLFAKGPMQNLSVCQVNQATISHKLIVCGVLLSVAKSLFMENESAVFQRDCVCFSSVASLHDAEDLLKKMQ